MQWFEMNVSTLRARLEQIEKEGFGDSPVTYPDGDEIDWEGLSTSTPASRGAEWQHYTTTPLSELLKPFVRQGGTRIICDFVRVSGVRCGLSGKLLHPETASVTIFASEPLPLIEVEVTE